MQTCNKQNQSGEPRDKKPVENIHVPLNQRLTYSPAEFAGLFGRGKTWTYRQCYAGRVKGITVLGQLMIPRTEAERLLTLAGEYNPNPARSPKRRKAMKEGRK